MGGPHLALVDKFSPQSTTVRTPGLLHSARSWRARGLVLSIIVLGASSAAVGARADTQCDFLTRGSNNARCSCTAVAQGSTERCPPSEAPCQILLPRGFPCPKVPPDSPLTTERIELGRFLFYDMRLSGNQTFACATCHEQAKAFTDGRAVAMGSTGELHPRSSMSLTNVVYAGTLAWANPNLIAGAFGHPFGALEEQALIPMLGDQPIELGMAGKEEEIFDRLRADPRYQRLFAEAFAEEDDRINLETIRRAIASFERTLISGNSAYDRFVFGVDDEGFSPSAQRGERLFFDDSQVECFHCHPKNHNLSDSIEYQGQAEPERFFHNTGLYNIACADVGLRAARSLLVRFTPTSGAVRSLQRVPAARLPL